MTTQEQRAEWSALAQAATPGEWAANTVRDTRLDIDVVWVENSMASIVWCGAANRLDVHANAAFIAAARAAVPALLADVDALTQDRDALAAELASCRNRLVLAQNHNEMHERLWREAETLRQTEVDALAAELARVRGDYEYIRQRAPWGAIQRLAWYGAENYNYSTDAKQVEEYVAGFHPNAQQHA